MFKSVQNIITKTEKVICPKTGKTLNSKPSKYMRPYSMNYKLLYWAAASITYRHV